MKSQAPAPKLEHVRHGTSPAETNASRLLDGLGISYELRAYDVDESDLSATTVARKIGLPPEQVFKTLLTASTHAPTRAIDYFFAAIPGNAELDLKKLAHAAGARKVELAPLKQVGPLTGYVRGGVTVMAARRSFPAYIDETVQLFDIVSVSAGQRGLQLLLAPEDYVRATAGRLHDLTRFESPPPE